jgi:hypothetical protein
MAFTRACLDADVVQRVFLPQPRDEYLRAVGSGGPDFSEEEKDTARRLLASPHVIQERVVSDAGDRRDRFHDTNLEIARVSDVLICVVAPSQSDGRGGTVELIELADKRLRPVLEVEISVRDGVPVLSSQWRGRELFRCPRLPGPLADAAMFGVDAASGELPPVADCVAALKAVASQRANWERKLFKTSAFFVIGAHIAATVIAVAALKLHGAAVPRLLAAELLLLIGGFSLHRYLHRTHRVGYWALLRLAAEVARSVAAIGSMRVYLAHLFTLPFPGELRPLLRSLSVLHLRAATSTDGATREELRDAYVAKRLVDRRQGAQIPYNEDTRAAAATRLRLTNGTFLVFSFSAVLATLAKLLAKAGVLLLAANTAEALGVAAVVFPVIAVAALSLAAAFDLEARLHTSVEMLEFLAEQKTLLENASSAREYSRLLIETESRLLGETVNWYARRSFVGVG